MKLRGPLLTTLALSACFSLPAHAIPITFDLSGTLRQTVDWDFASNTQTVDLSRAGTAFSAQFVLETDLFAEPVASEADISRRLSFRSLAGDAVSRTLMADGLNVPLTPFTANSAVISVGDSKGWVCSEPTGCRFAPDQWNLSMISEEISAQGPSVRRLITMGLSAYSIPSDPLAGTDWFNFDDGFDIGTIGSLPLDALNPINLSLQDYRFACAERCLATGQIMNWFEVSSITRTVGNVPEPGTLALLGVGLGFSMALRRRRQRPMN
jgi:hypothetical protein